MDNKIICIVGPTASGKTKLSIDLANAINGEIICGDSMQIYKSLNIATAKPTIDEMSLAKHHMFDFLEPTEEFSVAKYVKMADDIISDIKSRGKVPIITGGTGLYIDSLVRGNVFAQKKDENIRKKYEDIALEYGNEYLHSLLKDIDLESYEKLFPNDIKRVVRALEVYEITGKTISCHNEETKLIPNKYDATYIAINFENRNKLYDRINMRVDIMIENGLENEARNVVFNEEIKKTAFSAIGYKEFLPYFSNETTLDETIDKIKQESRRYAKRQITWYRRNPTVNWISFSKDSKKMCDDAIHIIKGEKYGKSL